MLADDLPLDRPDDPFAVADPMCLQEAGVIAPRNEADLVAVRLVGDRQIQVPRELAHRGLVERPHREDRVRQLRLRQGEEKIGLVLVRIEAAEESIPPRGLVALDPGVVPGADQPRPEAGRAVHQRRELQVAVAVYARDRRPSRRVLAHEVRDHRLVELLLEVDDVVGDAEAGRDPAGVVQVVDRAAGAELRLPLRLVVELHRQTDDVMPLAGQQGGRDRGVDPARHGDYDSHGESLKLRIRIVNELQSRGSAFSSSCVR